MLMKGNRFCIVMAGETADRMIPISTCMDFKQGKRVARALVLADNPYKVSDVFQLKFGEAPPKHLNLDAAYRQLDHEKREARDANWRKCVEVRKVRQAQGAQAG